MKTLYIVRHAKSSWDAPDLNDLDRPLNDRGEKDAPRMGKRLKERNVTPGAVYSSPAVRAFSTAKLIVDAIGSPSHSIHIKRALYHADAESLLRVVHAANDNADSIMIVGHNPGLTEFANDLLNEFIDNIPTAGVVAAQLKINSWKNAVMGCGTLLFFDFPKNK